MGFSIVMGDTPIAGGFILWNILLKWMINGGTAISGNLHNSSVFNLHIINASNINTTKTRQHVPCFCWEDQERNIAFGSVQCVFERNCSSVIFTAWHGGMAMLHQVFLGNPTSFKGGSWHGHVF